MACRFLTALLFTLLTGFSALAQQFTASADKTQLTLNETFTLEYSISGAGTDFEMPPLPDFFVLSGPQVSSFSAMVNGRRTESKLSYSFELQPRHTGKIIIPSASIIINGKKVSSNPIEIDVLAAPKAAAQKHKGKEDITAAKNEDLFLRVLVSKSNAVVGEAVTVTYKLYLRNIQLDEYNINSSPSFNGFWVEDVPVSSPVPLSTEVYKGKKYQAGVIKKTILFPQKAGKLEIEPLMITATGENAGFRDPFEDFSQSGNPRDLFRSFAPFQVNLNSNAMSIDVQPLPLNGKPADFSGFVGQASVSSDIDTKKVKANEPVSYKLTVQGAGNLKLLMAPKLHLDNKTEVYDPVTEEKAVKGNDNIIGSKTFTYTLIPRSQGTIIIPAQNFVYYNPDTKTYENSHTQPYQVEVLPAETYTKAEKPQKEEAAPTEKEQSQGLPLPWVLALGLGIPAIAAAAFILMKPKPAKVKKEVVLPEAVPTSRDSFEIARKSLSEKDRDGFFSAMQDGIYTFLHEITALSVADTNQENIRIALKDKGFSSEKIESFLLLLERVEFAKYAPPGSHFMEEESLLLEAERLMS